MASSTPVLTSLIRQTPVRCPGCLRPAISQSFTRSLSSGAGAMKARKKAKEVKQKKKKSNTHFALPDLKRAEQFSLCDAMRYIRAFEVGQSPTQAKYELAIRLATLKNGPVIRNRLRLPHPVDTSTRVAVVADPNSQHGKAAAEAGAVLVGEDTLFQAVKDGRIEFDRLICHQDSLQALAKAGVARILGPRGLMPSAKTGTVVKDVSQALKDSVSGSEYRERTGVLRLAIGQLGFTPEELQRNIKTLMESVMKDCSLLNERSLKAVHEVVLSSTRAPGFTLNGDFQSESSVPTQALSVL